MGILLDDAPLPIQDPIVRARRQAFRDRPDPLEGIITDVWAEYMTRLVGSVNQSPGRINSVEKTTQSASIGATDFSGGAIKAGLYRLSWYARITQAAGTSSSLTVAVTWTDGGVVQTFTGAAITGNTTATNQSNSILIRSDASSPVRYSATYVSVGSPVMTYSLYLTIEEVKA